MSIWERTARKLKKENDTIVNWNEGFFICPECIEPIYSDDWADFDYICDTKHRNNIYCPICEERIAQI